MYKNCIVSLEKIIFWPTVLDLVLLLWTMGVAQLRWFPSVSFPVSVSVFEYSRPAWLPIPSFRSKPIADVKWLKEYRSLRLEWTARRRDKRFDRRGNRKRPMWCGFFARISFAKSRAFRDTSIVVHSNVPLFCDKLTIISKRNEMICPRNISKIKITSL